MSGKGFFEWLDTLDAACVCLQETKAQPEQLGKEFFTPSGYQSYWASAVKKGYSGVCVYTKDKPKEVSFLGDSRFDDEGRVLRLDFEDYVLFNCYFPNSQEAGARLDYKLAFCEALKAQSDAVRASGKTVLICGDYNIAHKPIDLEYPDANVGNPGYLPEERAWMDEFIASGYLDTLREFNKEAKQYSWWSYRTRARERNVGWRIDYFCTNQEAKNRIKDAGIMQSVLGSDHCPVWIDLD